jgi:transcription elongation factor Elf1
MKPLTDKQYLKKFNHCPACLSTDITGGELNVDCNTARQKISCNTCGATWNDLYKLIGYADLDHRK